MIPENEWLTVKQVADILQASIYTVYELVRQEIIPSVKVGKRLIRIPRAEFLEAMKTGLKPKPPVIPPFTPSSHRIRRRG